MGMTPINPGGQSAKWKCPLQVKTNRTGATSDKILQVLHCIFIPWAIWMPGEYARYLGDEWWPFPNRQHREGEKSALLNSETCRGMRWNRVGHQSVSTHECLPNQALNSPLHVETVNMRKKGRAEKSTGWIIYVTGNRGKYGQGKNIEIERIKPFIPVFLRNVGLTLATYVTAGERK